jgi:hypothetical protein
MASATTFPPAAGCLGGGECREATEGGAHHCQTLAAIPLFPDPVYASAHAGLAQSVEHLICNQGVAGSNPATGTTKNKHSVVTAPGEAPDQTAKRIAS